MSSFGLGAAFSTWHGAFVVLVIGALSVYLVALIIVRINFFLKAQIDSQKLLGDARASSGRVSTS